MAESGTYKNKIFVIKIKADITKLSSSALMSVYIDSSNAMLLKHNSTLITGNKLYSADLSKPYKELNKIIDTSTDKHEVMPEINQLLIDNFAANFPDKLANETINEIKSDNNEIADSHLRKAIEGALRTENIDIMWKWELISRGEFEEIRVEEEINKLTLSSKVRMAQKYVSKKPGIAEKIVQNNIDDIAIIKFSFRGNKYSGACLILYCLSSRGFARMFIAVSKDNISENMSSGMPVVNFHERINDILASAELCREQITEIEAGFKNLSKSALYELISKNNPEKIHEVISRIFSEKLDEKLTLDINMEFMNPVKLDLLIHLPEKAEEDPVLEKDTGREKVQLINVNLVLAPSKGVQLTSLKEGNEIQVVIDKESPLGYKIIKSLGLLEGDKIKPIGAKVHTVRYNEREGFTIYVKIAENLFGKAYEEENIKIKSGDPIIEKEMKKSNISLIMGIVTGIIIVLLVLIYLISNN